MIAELLKMYNVRNIESISAIFYFPHMNHGMAGSTLCTSMLAQKITNHCSISSSGPREGGKTQAVIRGAFCVGLGGGGGRKGRREMNQGEEEQSREGDGSRRCKQVSLARSLAC